MKTWGGDDVASPTWELAQEWCDEMPKNGRILRHEWSWAFHVTNKPAPTPRGALKMNI